MWANESKVRAEEEEEDVGEVLDGSAARATGLTVLTRWLWTEAGPEGMISMDNGIPADGPQGSLLAALPSPSPPFPL